MIISNKLYLDESFDKFAEGVHLTNYQQLTGSELLAAKFSNEKPAIERSFRGRMNDLPR